MDIQMLAHNIRRLRIAQRLSQQTLADSAGISLPAIKKLESSKSEPRMKTLQAIAKALSVKSQELFQPVRELKTVRFRSNKKMQNRENILAEVSNWLDNFNFLEKLLNGQQTFPLDKTEAKCSTSGEIINATKLCRAALKLKPDEPIHNICGLLEHAGIKIYTVSSASDGFFGLSVGKEDGGPAIAVNTWERISVERRIFSAVHELGHLILHNGAFDVSETKEKEDEERQADLFAGHFLMPDEGFCKEWNEAAGLHFVDRVLKVKRIFHVSYLTVLVRLKEYKVVDDSIRDKFRLEHQHRFKRKRILTPKEEPNGLVEFDFYEERFSRLVRQALEEEKISLSRGAEMFRIGIEEMQELSNSWEVVL